MHPQAAGATKSSQLVSAASLAQLSCSCLWPPTSPPAHIECVSYVSTNVFFIIPHSQRTTTLGIPASSPRTNSTQGSKVRLSCGTRRLSCSQCENLRNDMSRSLHAKNQTLGPCPIKSGLRSGWIRVLMRAQGFLAATASESEQEQTHVKAEAPPCSTFFPFAFLFPAFFIAPLSGRVCAHLCHALSCSQGWWPRWTRRWQVALSCWRWEADALRARSGRRNERLYAGIRGVLNTYGAAATQGDWWWRV